MAKNKKQENTGTSELYESAQALRKEIQTLGMEGAKGQLKQTTQLRTKKDELARILTKMTMMKFATEVEKKGDKK